MHSKFKVQWQISISENYLHQCCATYARKRTIDIDLVYYCRISTSSVITMQHVLPT